LKRENRMIVDEHRASSSQECGECEEKWPQDIDMIDEIRYVHALLQQEGGMLDKQRLCFGTKIKKPKMS
jgi:predicted aldo/keto reductase-like oxidoreductase